LGFFVDEGEVHVAAIPGKPFNRLCHKAWGYSKGSAERLDAVFEKAGAISHASDFPVLQRGFVDARSGLCVPALDINIELLACYGQLLVQATHMLSILTCIKNAIIKLLVL
jgi:hypothetical protein